MDEDQDQVRYRFAFGAAYSAVEPMRQRARVFDADNPRDVAELRTKTLKALGAHADTIPRETIDEAIADVLHRRPPRW